MLGSNTSNFTATNGLFLNNPQVTHWRFEVVYVFPNESTTSALNFVINQPPRNGSCSISPGNGTTTTVFTVSCANWYDEDGIKEYALYSATEHLVAFSALPNFDVRLPSGDSGNASSLQLVVVVRDTSDCVTRMNLTSVVVRPDSSTLSELVDILNRSNALLSTGNQNTVSQLLTSFSEQLNTLNNDAINNATASIGADD